MTYEVNESHFFEVLGINQIKTFSYLFANQEYNDHNFTANILLNLTYYDQKLQEKFVNLSFPLALNIDNYQEDGIELKNVNLLVIENQGVKLEFDLEIWLSDEVAIVEDDDSETMQEDEIQEVKELIKEEYQNDLEATILTNDNKIGYQKESNSFNLASLKTSFKRYRVLFVDDEAKINAYSNEYCVSMDELYQAKKHNQRLIIDVES